MVEGLPSNHEENNWWQPGGRDGELCSNRYLMMGYMHQAQDLTLVQAWVVFPVMRHDMQAMAVQLSSNNDKFILSLLTVTVELVPGAVLECGTAYLVVVV